MGRSRGGGGGGGGLAERKLHTKSLKEVFLALKDFQNL